MSAGGDPTVVRLGLGPGTRLNGLYEIERLVAVGGMGEVYRGRAIETGDAVAIKTIRPEMAKNEAALALFRKEASALHNLYHEAIVRYYVFSVDPVLGAPYLAMEYVDGLSLSDLVRRGPLAFEAVDALRRRLASGLEAAHRLSIVHRDVSPDNVILPAGDVTRAKIIDFGIARQTLGAEATVIGSGFAGKLAYVSPEQLGLYGGEVTGRSDIYSLGLVLAEALRGERLDMGGSQAEVVDKRRRLPDLTGVDGRLRPLLARMLEPDPHKRIASMAEVAAWQSAPVSAPRKLPLVLTGLAAAAALATAGVLVVPRVLERGADGAAQNRAEVPDLTPSTAVAGSPAMGSGSPAPPAEETKAPAPASQPSPPPAAIPPAETRPATATASPPAPAEPRPVPTSQAQAAPTPAVAQPVPATPPPPAEVQRPAPAPASPTLAERPAPAAERPQAPPPVTPPGQPAPEKPTTTAQLIGPRTNPASVPDATERLARYVRDYEAGDCVYLSPISLSPTSASVEAFGPSAAPFRAFDEAFKRANGFEAQISVRLVTDAQCPAVAFMRKVGIDRGSALKLQLASFSLRETEPLNGSIEGAGGRQVEVILVSDDGYVYNLANFLKRESSNAASFTLRVNGRQGTRGRPQLVMAIASREPLALLQSDKPLAADALFPLLTDEARTQGSDLVLTVKYFRFEG